MALVISLQDLDRTAIARAGGKAANLGELIRAGLPVPPGFVLTTDAYAGFVTAHALQPAIERLVATLEPEAASSAIASLFAKPVPETISLAVREAYQHLGSPVVAVRSSATAEDLADASFAGQMESYLAVRSAEALLQAVRRCWASLWTARAIAYRARLGIPPSAIRLAVIVQELVVADAAGVLFTANPVTGHRGQMTIDAVPGLGDALVAGQVTPDHWVVDRATGRVLEARLANKERMTVASGHGTVLQDVPEERRRSPSLDEATLARLLDLGRKAEDHFAVPQDIEWALASGRLFLVQSRPITSLFPVPHPAPAPEDGLRIYVCFNILQGIVEPFTPAGIAVFRCLMNAMAAFKYGIHVPRGAAAPAFKVAAGRIYGDVTVPLRHPRARRVLPRMVGIMDRHIAEIVTTLLERQPELAPVQRRLPVRLPLHFALGVLGRLLWVEVSPETAPGRLVASVERLVRQIEEQADGIHDPAHCQDFALTKLAVFWPQLIYHAMPLILPGVTARFLAEYLLGRWLNDPAALQPMLRSLPHNPTMEMDLILWRISRQLKEEGREPSPEHPRIREFLAHYGHRGVREIDVGMPRWRDDPEHILSVLRTYLRHAEDSDPVQQFHQGEQAAEQASRELIARVRREKGWLRARMLQFLLRRIRALLGRREYPKFVMVRVLAAVRRMLGRAGAVLVAAGRLDQPDDVYFLDLNDLTSSADLRAVVARNRAEYARELGRKVIPRILTSTGEAFYTAPSTTPGALIGTAASAGTYEGIVRIILDPHGAHLEPGEVLVAPGTDPAWTPLFLSAGALVMELGGIMSHGSVVAREYGIPAVVGVPGATQQLRTGQRVRVDGENGQIVPL